MKKNFINPEIKISLFNQERIRTELTQAADPMATTQPVNGSGYNYNDALKWLEDRGIKDATNIISFKE